MRSATTIGAPKLSLMVSSAVSVDSVADDGYSKKEKKASKRHLHKLHMISRHSSSSQKMGHFAPENSKEGILDWRTSHFVDVDDGESEYADLEQTPDSVTKIRRRRKFPSPIPLKIPSVPFDLPSPIPDMLSGKGDEKGFFRMLANAPLKIIPSVPFDVRDVFSPSERISGGHVLTTKAAVSDIEKLAQKVSYLTTYVLDCHHLSLSLVIS